MGDFSSLGQTLFAPRYHHHHHQQQQHNNNNNHHHNQTGYIDQTQVKGRFLLGSELIHSEATTDTVDCPAEMTQHPVRITASGSAQKRKKINKTISKRKLKIADSPQSSLTLSNGYDSIPCSGSTDFRHPGPLSAIQVPSVDSLTDLHSQTTTGSTSGGGGGGFRQNPDLDSTSGLTMPGIKSRTIPDAPRSRKPDRRKQPRHRKCVIATSKDIDDVTRTGTYDWYGFYGAAPGYPAGPESYFRGSGVNQDSGGFGAAQENCHTYLYPPVPVRHGGIGPELVLSGTPAALMGETGPAAEKLKQIAAQHQMKESTRYGDTEWYVDEYSGYQYGTEAYSSGTVYQHYPESAYLLQVRYPDGIELGEGESFGPDGVAFGATKPLSHFPIYAEHGSLPGRFHGDDLDPTNQSRMLRAEQEMAPAATNRNAGNYVNQVPVTGSANQLQTTAASSFLTSSIAVKNDVIGRTVMTQYGHRLQGKQQGDSVALNCNGRTTVEPRLISDKPRSGSCGSEGVSPHSVHPTTGSPFLAAPTNYLNVGVEVGGCVGVNPPMDRDSWPMHGGHLYPVLREHPDISGNRDFPEVAGHPSSIPETSLECTGSPLLIAKRNQAAVSMQAPTSSGSNFAAEIVSRKNRKSGFSDSVERGACAWPVPSHPTRPGPIGDPVGPPSTAQWPKCYPDGSGFNFRCSLPYPLDTTEGEGISTSSSREDPGPTATAPTPTGSGPSVIMWGQTSNPEQSTSQGTATHRTEHFRSCNYRTAPATAAAAAIGTTVVGGTTTVVGGTTTVAEFVGGPRDSLPELFIYGCDGESGLELNFIDELLSVAR